MPARRPPSRPDSWVRSFPQARIICMDSQRMLLTTSSPELVGMGPLRAATHHFLAQTRTPVRILRGNFIAYDGDALATPCLVHVAGFAISISWDVRSRSCTACTLPLYARRYLVYTLAQRKSGGVKPLVRDGNRPTGDVCLPCIIAHPRDRSAIDQISRPHATRCPLSDSPAHVRRNDLNIHTRNVRAVRTMKETVDLCRPKSFTTTMYVLYRVIAHGEL